MSLLSRFRETVLPSISRNKKLVDDNVRNYNYRKPTISFNEKSVKSKNSAAQYSHADDNNLHHCDAAEKSARSNRKLSKTSISKSTVQQSANKNKRNNHSSADNATLSRSNTFTLDEEEQFQNETHSKSKRKDKYSDADGKKCYYRQVRPINGKGKLSFNKTIKRKTTTTKLNKSSCD